MYERLETELRGHDRDPVHLAEERCRMSWCREQAYTFGVLGECAILPAEHHVGVSLHDQLCVWSVLRHGADHSGEVSGGEAASNGLVPRGLVDDKDALTLARTEIDGWLVVVLGESARSEFVYEVTRAASCGFVERVFGDRELETRGPGRVVVDADVVHDERERWLANHSGPDASQEAVFEREEWRSPSGRDSSRGLCVALRAPAGGRVPCLVSAHDLRAQERLQVGDSSNTPRRHPYRTGPRGQRVAS